MSASELNKLKQDADRNLSELDSGSLDKFYKQTYERDICLGEIPDTVVDKFLLENFEIYAKIVSQPRLFVKQNRAVLSGQNCRLDGIIVEIKNGQPPLDQYFLPMGDHLYLFPGENQFVKDPKGEKINQFNISGGGFYAQTTFIEGLSNCVIRFPTTYAILEFTKNIPGGGEVCIFLEKDPLKIASEKFNLLFSLCKCLFMWDFELPHCDAMRVFRELQYTCVFHLLNLTSSIEELQLLLSHFVANNQLTLVTPLLNSCIEVINGDYKTFFAPQDGLNLEYDSVAIKFPNNHLVFASVRNTFRFDFSAYKDKKKLRHVEEYLRYQHSLFERKQLVIPARTNDECWIELGDDCEYFLPLNR
jgi:hypothetical protein